MYGAKCLTAAPMHKASTSHGSQFIWCVFILALKNPAISGLPSRSTKRVAARPFLLPAASVTIWSSSSDLGMVIDFVFDKQA
jgi:bacteriorhodopsin